MTHSSIIAKIIYILFFIGIVNPIFSQAPEEPVYYEGEIYQSQIIGSQCWMTENLNVGSFIQGTTLLTNNGIVEKYCYDNSIANCDSFGGLYPWNELMNYLSVEGSQGICPIGWHIPTKIDWNTLIGQYPFLSSSDSLVWTGNSGFDALLGGYSNGNGGFSQLGIIGAYYSSNSYNGNNNRRVFPGSGRVLREGCSASDAYSVRCIRNNIYNTVPFALTLSSQSVSCNGGNDGTIFMSLAGVSNPSFIWSNGATTEDLYNVSAGTYSVTVTEGSNTLSETIVVGEASDIVPVLSITSQIGCYNESDGSLNVTCTGGTPPYSYVWSTNNVTPNLTNIPAGTYFVTIFDNNNCQTIGEIAILNPTLFVDFSSIVTMPSCNGNNDGAIDIIPDVAGFYTYSWSNFQAVEDISGLFAGNFGITVTDTLTNYCTVDNFEIISPDPISIVDVITNTSDVGLSDASINISVSGGTSPYNYSWSNGASTEDISNIPAGSYLVTIVDANNCTFTSDALLVTEPGITAGIPTITNVSCYGSQNGAISVTATSGCSGWGCISYSIVTGVTQSYGGFWNLSAGTYNMTITDNIGGLVVVENIIVTEPDQIEIISFVEETGCSGANITVNASGGTGTLEYSINGVDYFISNVFSDVPAGTTTFFVRDSVYCDTSENYVVSPVDLMSVSGVTTDASCFGNSDGSIQLSVINGVSPFTYTWSNGLTGNYIYNLPAGNYTVTVTDANSCSETATFYIDEPDLLLISLTGTDVTYPQGINGTISTSIAGGFTPFSFNWSNGSTQQNLTNISEGNYTLTVQDCQLCSATASIQISENLLPVSININSSDVSCYGGNNGAAYANASGGNAPYSFLWSNGATTQNILNLVAGTYTLTVTGFYGMTGTTSVIIYEPSEVSGNITIISNYNSYDVSCSQCTDGQINVSAQGGTSPYTYNWSNGGTNANQNNLGAGNYSVTITDIAGCEDIKSVSLNEPDELQLAVQVISNFSGYNVSCPGGNNGIATGNVTGGVSPYSYLWSSGANTAVATGLASQTYSLTVTDVYGIEASGYVSLTAPLALSIQINPINNLCNGNSNGLLSIAVNGGITPYTYNWSNGATDNVAVNLAAGYYTLTVTDSHNCQSTSSSFISQPSIINIAPAITNISCFGDNNGAIDITVTGGVNPYTFLWSTNSSFEDITNLSSGAYSIAVTDFNGCTQIHDNIVIGQPSEINTNITVTQPSDYGIADGAIAMTVSGGVSPYSFLWSNGATTQSISGLLPGTFNVTIVDSENCTKNESVVVSLPSGLYFTATINHVSCFGFSNGEINITVNSGVSPYSYFWSNGGTTNQITELATGEYFITIIDSNNNTNTDSYLVTEPDDLNINFISSDVSCFGDSDGSIEALVTGGTEPYDILWSNSQTTSINNGLTAGVYGIYVTDSNNCMILDGTGVDQPGEINAVLTKHNATDIGLTNGWANLDVSGGTPPYTYLWTNDSTNSSCNSLGAGTYFVMITDAGLCTEWINFEILDDPSLTIYGCDDPQALNFNPLANTNDSSCVYIDNPPDWQYGYSGISHTILLPSASQITISETAIEPGDYIGLFYDSLGSLACAGYVMWLNDNPNIIAWGNTGTLVSPNGFAIGEVFQWKIWDASDSIEYDAGAVYDLTGYPNVAYYFNNGVSSISNLTAISSQTQDILLEYNWSNFSTYIEPFEPDIEDVFLDIISNVNVVKDGSGNIYWPQYGVNNIGSIEIGQGYKIKMDITQVLSITGIAISPEEIEIPLPLNWSILGYLRQTPASIEYLLYSIVQNIQVVKNGSGVIYWPQYGVNNIGNMISGDGYDIKMNFVDTLVYSANFTNVPLSSSKSSVTTSKQELIKITDKNMTLGIPLSSWDILPEYGDEINVYSETGLIIGSAPFVRENTAITIWGNDELSHEKDGLVDNENFTIRIESAKGKNVILNVEYWIEGDQTYSDNGISIIGKIMTNNTIQSDFTLSQNTPNPFNTNTKIEFSIPNPQYVNISIYNELGELVAEPVNREFSNGTHIIEFDGSGFSAGMYYYTLKAGDFIKSYKMTKIK